MENNMNKPETISYFEHEAAMARQERHVKRLWILCIIIFFSLIATNAGWIWYENQFEDVVTTVTQDTPSGNNNFIGHDGDITNGEANHQNENQETENGR
jgi:hypothetical protein